MEAEPTPTPTPAAGAAAGTLEKLRALQAKFSRLRDGQDIVLQQVDPTVPIVVKKAKVRGHHGVETSGAKVSYQQKETV